MTTAVPPNPGVPPPASNSQPAAAHPSSSSSNANGHGNGHGHSHSNAPVYPQPSTPVAPSHQAASPPSKRDLKSWWKGFKLAPKHQDANGEHAPSGSGDPSASPYNYYKALPPASYRQATVFSEAVGSCPPLEATTSSETLKGGQPQPTASCVSLPSSDGPQTTQARSRFRQLHKSLSGCFPSASSSLTAAQCASPHDKKQKQKKKQKKREAKQRCKADSKGPGIFGVPLRQSIHYANVAISLVDDNGKSYIYGYVPIVVAKCGVFLKEKATGVEGIFRLSGSEKRIKELKQIFDSPDRYGKGLNWEGYTVHDAANVLRRYLNDLPEPVVPLDLYEKFRQPLRGAVKQAAGDAEGPQFVEDFDLDAAIREYQRLITELPPLNRQLLLYILDLLAVFAAKADENRMTSQNLAAIFQPGMLSHPAHAMAPEEYRLNQCVIIFLIENQDHFLIGMQGTAADEKTVQEVQNGTPPVSTPVTPMPTRTKSGLHRSASNASAGAESVAREGMVRRNRSTSSRHSRQSTGGPSPGTPAPAPTPTGGLGRSNTVPSKKSPAALSARFQKRGDHSPAPVSPMTPVVVHSPAPPTVAEEPTPESGNEAPAVGGAGPAHPRPEGRAKEKPLLEAQPELATPSRERNLQSLFQRSPGGDGEKRAPNKLRKKRIPNSANPSAQSSTVSLSHSVAAASPAVEVSNPLEGIAEPAGPEAGAAGGSADPRPAVAADETPSEPTPRASQAPSQSNLHPASAEGQLRSRKSPPASLYSSFNEGSSDADQVEELPAPADLPEHSEQQQDRERKRRWRLSRKKEDMAGAGAGAGAASPPAATSPKKVLGNNTSAEMSTSTVGSSSAAGGQQQQQQQQRPRRSLTGESSDHHPTNNPAAASAEALSSHESGSRERSGGGGGGGGGDPRDDGRSLTGWIKTKYREHKESAEQRRNKSPPPADRPPALAALLPAAAAAARGKSLDLHRPPAEGETSPVQGGQQGQQGQQQQSPPPPVPPLPLPAQGQQQPQPQQPQPQQAHIQHPQVQQPQAQPLQAQQPQVQPPQAQPPQAQPPQVQQPYVQQQGESSAP